MASVSGTSSLGNTALRGFGGLATGLDRDALIEQMTMGTQNKIDNKKSDMTKLEWKQDAYQTISDMILALQDNYFTYSSSNNLMSSAFFAKNQITAIGDPDITKFVTASGSSDMMSMISILGVKELASSAVQKSDEINGAVTINGDRFADNSMVSSNLAGKQLRFATWHEGTDGGEGYYENKVTFELPSTYKDENGKVQQIDYTAAPEEVAKNLQTALEQSGLKMGDEKLSDIIEFSYDGDKLSINKKDGATTQIVIQENSTALEGLGYQKSADGSLEKNGISLDEYNANLGSFKDSYVNDDFENAFDYLKGKTLSFTYNGVTKNIALVTEDEYSSSMNLDTMVENVQKRLNDAFGEGNVIFDKNESGDLKITTKEESSTLSVSSSDSVLLSNLGLEKGASTKINLSDTLDQANLGLDLSKYSEDGKLNLEINGTKIEGLTINSTVGEIIDKINNTKGVGVKATYVDTTGQFVLISEETGSGRQIDISNPLASELFGGSEEKGGGFVKGKDAVIAVSYGNGMTVEINRSSNTFDLEGMKVTVTGTFGYVKDSSGNLTLDENSGSSVSFSGKADIDGVTEAVSKFIEEYNAMVTEVNNQLTTKSDSSYGPLTDAQKDEMTEKEIEQWEEKAKSGLLFGDSTIRNLSMDLQNVLVSMVSSNGISLQELEEMGISVSDDYSDGGTISFDETKFRKAMEEDPERVGEIFAGGSDITTGLSKTIEDTLTKYATRYATRNGGSYGSLIELAGSEKVPLSVSDNQIYKELKTMQEDLQTLRERLATEQDRYITQFASIETLISQMNSQSSWLSSLG